MSRKVEYYCDCCKKQVDNREKLRDIDVVINRREKSMYETRWKEVCFDCWKEYQDGIVKVGKDLFDSKSKKDIEKEDIKIEKDKAEYTIVISIDENKINEMIKEFNLVMQEIELRLRKGIDEFKESIKTTAHKNID